MPGNKNDLEIFLLIICFKQLCIYNCGAANNYQNGFFSYYKILIFRQIAGISDYGNLYVSDYCRKFTEDS
jgi:hypothetical protein